MSVEINVSYQGELRTQITHGPSGCQVITDAPKDNHGKGQSFSPTDTVAAALGSCMLTIMGIEAAKRGIDLVGTHVKVEKHMVADPERRIGALPSVITIPNTVFEKDRPALEQAALNCPVHKSLDARINRPVEFVWLT